MSLGPALLLRWLLSLAVGTSELPERDYLPGLPTVEWVRKCWLAADAALRKR